MVASIGKISSPSQGASHFEKGGYYARDDPAHREASAWAGKGAAALGLSGPVDADAFRAVLEGRVPGGRQFGRKDRDGNIQHRHGRDVTQVGVADGDGRRRRPDTGNSDHFPKPPS